MRTAKELGEEAVEELRGTCREIYHLGPEFEDVQEVKEFTDVLDSEIFKCEVCEWWCEMCQMAERRDERWICEECTDQEEDEE